MQTEVWKPIPGWESLYEVSTLGRVRSLDRTIFHRGLGYKVSIKGRVMKPTPSGATGHLHIGLKRDGTRHATHVHRLVMDAFVGPLPDGLQTRHLNGNPADNRLENLQYGTPSENQYDRVAHGTHNHAGKPKCKRGHAFTPENTYRRPSRQVRECRTCKRLLRKLRAADLSAVTAEEAGYVQ